MLKTDMNTFIVTTKKNEFVICSNKPIHQVMKKLGYKIKKDSSDSSEAISTCRNCVINKVEGFIL